MMNFKELFEAGKLTVFTDNKRETTYKAEWKMERFETELKRYPASEVRFKTNGPTIAGPGKEMPFEKAQAEPEKEIPEKVPRKSGRQRKD